MKPGGTIDRYKIESVLGEGGMATVYRARHQMLGSLHAIKILDPRMARHKELRARFLDEGRIQARLRHPHIVPVTDIIAEPGVAGLVMPMLKGGDLEGYLKQVDHIDAPTAVRWCCQALSALAYVHDSGVVHRDLKPGNMFLEQLPDGTRQVRLVDFGIAKMVDNSKTRTGIGVMGTIAYMSPEQIWEPKDVDGRSDLFSMGIVLYEMLIGENPFNAPSGFAVQTKIIEGDYVPTGERLVDVPDEIGRVIDRALKTDREARFQTADAFMKALRQAANAQDVPTTRGPAPRASRKPPSGAAPRAAIRQPTRTPQPKPTPQPTQPQPQPTQPQPTQPYQARPTQQYRSKPPQPAPQPTSRAMYTPPVKPRQHTVRLGGVSVELFELPAGRFWMGSNKPDAPSHQRPAHEVTLSRSFMVAKLPVTQMLWRALMRSQPWSVDGSYLPVTGVSWYDCVQFCNKLSKKEGLPLAYSIDHQDPPTVTWDHKATGFRLLTEAEWEYAARAGEDHVYSGGNELDMVGWAASNSRDQLQSAGRKRANAWGIQDMSGLVVEWVWDRGGRYPSRPQTDPTGMKKGMTRVGRGGSWMRPPENAAVTDRQGEWPTKTPEDWGFRIGRYVRST